MQGGTTLLGGRGAGDGLTWMTHIVQFITVSVSTLFAIACSLILIEGTRPCWSGVMATILPRGHSFLGASSWIITISLGSFSVLTIFVSH